MFRKQDPGLVSGAVDLCVEGFLPGPFRLSRLLFEKYPAKQSPPPPPNQAKKEDLVKDPAKPRRCPAAFGLSGLHRLRRPFMRGPRVLSHCCPGAVRGGGGQQHNTVAKLDEAPIGPRLLCHSRGPLCHLSPWAEGGGKGPNSSEGNQMPGVSSPWPLPRSCLGASRSADLSRAFS
uniref:Uncharacterized protein n=1 Tax=Sphaerodactylus townsendi TaxID=933632 RepID=A0ACB8EXW6_9SAUR